MLWALSWNVSVTGIIIGSVAHRLRSFGCQRRAVEELLRLKKIISRTLTPRCFQVDGVPLPPQDIEQIICASFCGLATLQAGARSLTDFSGTQPAFIFLSNKKTAASLADVPVPNKIQFSIVNVGPIVFMVSRTSEVDPVFFVEPTSSHPTFNFVFGLSSLYEDKWILSSPSLLSLLQRRLKSLPIMRDQGAMALPSALSLKLARTYSSFIISTLFDLLWDVKFQVPLFLFAHTIQ
ncbi:unnamed protein product [Somion occarium]|uniref:Uncharacterized protein n=1 Tax=Somion occarium TaxID=3059160 RepID=A0ABP1EDT0_9APHY